MRLLFVHEVNWRRKVVYEIHDYPELLSLRGHDVVFVDFAEGDESGGLRSALSTRTTSRASRAHAGSYVEVRTPGRVAPPPWDRLLASLTQVPALRKVLAQGHVDAMVLYAVPTNGWQALLLARRHGVPVLFRAIDVSHELRDTRFRALVRAAERFIVRRADAVSTHNVALRDYLVSLGADPAGVSVDYPGLDLDRFSPGDRNPGLCRRYGIEPHHRVVLFMGTLYRFAGLDWFLEELAPRLAAQPELRVLLVGGGEHEAALRQLVARLGVEHSVVFAGFADYPTLADHLRLGDVAVNPFTPSPVTNCALPGKVLQYLGCGLPTVSTPLEGLRGLVPEGSGVIYREGGRPFVEGVLELLRDDSLRRVVGAAGRSVVVGSCDWDVAVDAFEAAISRAIRSRRGPTSATVS